MEPGGKGPTEQHSRCAVASRLGSSWSRVLLSCPMLVFCVSLGLPLFLGVRRQTPSRMHHLVVRLASGRRGPYCGCRSRSIRGSIHSALKESRCLLPWINSSRPHAIPTTGRLTKSHHRRQRRSKHARASTAPSPAPACGSASMLAAANRREWFLTIFYETIPPGGNVLTAEHMQTVCTHRKARAVSLCRRAPKQVRRVEQMVTGVSDYADFCHLQCA